MPVPSNSPVISSAGQLGNSVVETAAIKDAAVTVAKIAPGSDGEFLGVSGGDVAWLGAGLAPGCIVPYAGSSAPNGYLLADGSAVSRTTYAALFAIIADTYGAGDGSTTFNLPNLKGRVPVGYNAAETEFDALGETGGEKTHTLTTTEMPSHSHNMPQATGGSGVGQIGGTGLTRGPVNTDAAGSGGAHNNLQPYITLNYIIKT